MKDPKDPDPFEPSEAPRMPLRELLIERGREDLLERLDEARRVDRARQKAQKAKRKAQRQARKANRS